MLKRLYHRLPPRADIFPVYSLIVFWVYSWAVLVFLFNLPSWMLQIPISEILAFLCYALVFAFLDSLLMLGIVLLAAAGLPAAWLRDDFSVGGGILASCLILWVIIVNPIFAELVKWPAWHIALILFLAVFSAAVFVWIGRRVRQLRRFTLWLGTSAGLFVYLYGGLSVIGLLVVLARNLF